MDSVGEGEGGKIWENGIETCIISCMKQVTSPGSMHDTGCLGLVHWDDPEGGYGEGGGRRVQDGSTGIPVADSFRCLAKLIQYCKIKKKNTLVNKETFSFNIKEVKTKSRKQHFYLLITIGERKEEWYNRDHLQFYCVSNLV